MPELYVSKKTLWNLLEENNFIIPEYQREYAWDVEKCEVLFNDLLNFYNNYYHGEYYFLGSVIFFRNGQHLENITNDEISEKNKIEIIDGQQRITSFFLLMRAFYSKLSEMKANNPNNPQISGMLQQVSACIWNVDDQSNLPDFDNPRIETKILTDKYRKTLKLILSENECRENNKNNNY